MLSAAFTALLLAVSASSVQAQTPSYTGALLIQPQIAGSKCLTAANSNGAPVQLETCTGASSQKWTFKNGQVTLYSGSKCLDVVNGVNKDGTKLQVWDCGASSGSGQNKNQQFYYTGMFREKKNDSLENNLF